MTPVREITSQNASAAAIESAKVTGSANEVRRSSRAVAIAGPEAATSPAAIRHLSDADVGRDLARSLFERGREFLQEVVHRDKRAMHRDVDRRDDVARLPSTRCGNRAQ